MGYMWFYPFADILTMEKSEVESKIQEIFGEKVKIILFSVWSKTKITIL